MDEVFARLSEDPQSGQQDLAWYIADHLLSVRQIVKTNGDILDEITYDSFGNILSETNPAAGDRFKFTGREYDDLVDLYYYRARWYDPQLGKFLSEDPLGVVHPDSNKYRYIKNDPVNKTDPSGLEPTLNKYPSASDIAVEGGKATLEFVGGGATRMAGSAAGFVHGAIVNWVGANAEDAVRALCKRFTIRNFILSNPWIKIPPSGYVEYEINVEEIKLLKNILSKFIKHAREQQQNFSKRYKEAGIKIEVRVVAILAISFLGWDDKKCRRKYKWWINLYFVVKVWENGKLVGIDRIPVKVKDRKGWVIRPEGELEEQVAGGILR